MSTPIAIAIHGGAGTMDKNHLTGDLYKQYEQALRDALTTGLTILQKGGHSVDAVEAAVMRLEDCPFFNAGRGSVFNSKGQHEMDAAIMDGRTLKAGAVAGISQFKNPIQVARAVMDKSKYVLLSGTGASEFGRDQQLAYETEEYFYTESRYKEWKEKVQDPAGKKMGTVGAVALDASGNLAAATSTGGLTDKEYGRVGDSPVIGAGTYANNETCAVSCTGEGEDFLRAVVAYDVSCRMQYAHQSLEEACKASLMRLPKDCGGLIAVDRQGHIQMPFNTDGMYRACAFSNGKIEVKIFE